MGAGVVGGAGDGASVTSLGASPDGFQEKDMENFNFVLVKIY